MCFLLTKTEILSCENLFALPILPLWAAATQSLFDVSFLEVGGERAEYALFKMRTKCFCCYFVGVISFCTSFIFLMGV